MENNKTNNFGQLVLIGSGETSSYGKTLLRKVLQKTNRRHNVTILETPAGFQPNSHLVAQEIANVFTSSLPEFTADVFVIPARKKNTAFSPDDPKILSPLYSSDFIVFGPGSPTYTVQQLRNSKALEIIHQRWSEGASLCLSSAATLAVGVETLPVYEIYKAGADLHWIEGLNLLSESGMKLTVVPHWNNAEGGKNLDTRYCFMGEERFRNLKKLLPPERTILGIEENSAVIFDFTQETLRVIGKGRAVLQKAGRNEELILEKETIRDFNSISSYIY